MISCLQARHLFDAFLDDELSPAMRTELHTHRLSCPDCSRELALLEACADVVRTDRREPMPHKDFTDRMMVAFTSRRPVPVYRWRRIAVYAASPLAAAAVLVFAFTAWFHAPGHSKHGLVASRGDSLPPALVKEVAERGKKPLTQKEQEEIAKLTPLRTEDVLSAWLVPTVERANNTVAQTKETFSQLADFVRLGIIPPEILQQAQQVQVANNKPQGTNLDQELTGPPFDSPAPADQAFDQPEPTDKAATDMYEVF
jgi:Putative zinc-finger